MTKTGLPTAEHTPAVDAAAIESGSVTGLELIEGARIGVADAMFGEWCHLSQNAHRAVVICGPGKNRGTGLCLRSDWRNLGGWLLVMQTEMLRNRHRMHVKTTTDGAWREM